MADDKELQLKITKYGLDRIERAMEDPSLNLSLTKIKIGTGIDGKYYEITDDMLQKEDLDLQSPVEDVEFYVYDKELLEDGLTISFHTIIPETVGGFDIIEVGLYESTSDGDKLFALSVQQPFVKPSSEYNYLISINYYMFLKNENFNDLYDRITLDVEHAQVTEADMEELMRTFLFSQENLMLQIEKNSKIIGYNRPTQILDKVNENKQTFSYVTLYKNFASVLDLISSPNNIFSYWIFDYSRRETIGSNIVDLSNNKNYLTTNKLLSSYTHLYNGFQSMFSFPGTDNYSLSSNVAVDLYDPETQSDSPFTMVFVLEPHKDSYSKTRTIIAKVNEAVHAYVFKVQELPEGVLQVRLYSSENDYITFTSSKGVIPNSPHSIVLTYEPRKGLEEPQMQAYINSKDYLLKYEGEGEYTHMDPSASGTLYKYSCTPQYLAWTGTDTVGGTTVNNPVFCRADGMTTDFTDWTFSDDYAKVLFKDNEVEPSGTPVTKVLYTWGYWETESPDTNPPTEVVYTDTLTITENTKLYNENFEEIEQDETGFNIKSDGSEYKIYYGTTSTYTYSEWDISREIKSYVYSNTQDIYTTVTSIEEGTEYPLYLKSGDAYVEYTKPEAGPYWQFGDTNLYYVDSLATPNATAATVDTTPINIESPSLTSYVIGKDGAPKEYINSNVGIISIIKEKLSAANARILALNLCATLGRNPFLDGE